MFGFRKKSPPPLPSPSPEVLPPYIAVVDDDALVGRAFQRLLRPLRVNIRVFNSASAFLQTFEKRRPLAVITDVQMPGTSGIELRQMLRDRCCTFPIILISASDQLANHDSLKEDASTFFLTKPVEKGDLLQLLTPVLSPDAPASGLRLQQKHLDPDLVDLDEEEEWEPQGDGQGVEELEPCPFCASLPRLEDVKLRDKRGRIRFRARVVCPRCEASIYSDPDYYFSDASSAAEDAQHRWNRRQWVG